VQSRSGYHYFNRSKQLEDKEKVLTLFLFVAFVEGDLAKAEAVAREAITLVPRDPSLQFNLANTLGKRGRFAEAERHFMIAVDLDPLNAVFHSNMGT